MKNGLTIALALASLGARSTDAFLDKLNRLVHETIVADIECTKYKGSITPIPGRQEKTESYATKEDALRAFEVAERNPGVSKPTFAVVELILAGIPEGVDYAEVAKSFGQMPPSCDLIAHFNLIKGVLNTNASSPFTDEERRQITRAELKRMRQEIAGPYVMTDILIQVDILKRLVEGGFLKASPDLRGKVKGLDADALELKTRITDRLHHLKDRSARAEMETYIYESRETDVLRKKLLKVLETLRQP